MVSPASAAVCSIRWCGLIYPHDAVSAGPSRDVTPIPPGFDVKVLKIVAEHDKDGVSELELPGSVVVNEGGVLLLTDLFVVPL